MVDDRAILALHGFTQRGAMWDEIRSLLGAPPGFVAPDLPGHGAEPVPADVDAAVRALGRTIAELDRPVVVGYSMGGRLAALAAAADPDAVGHLILVSTALGIADPVERAARRARDLRLADEIEAVGTEVFVDRWLRQPMFAGLAGRDPGWRERDRAMRISNDPSGLAAALRRLGQGSQPYVVPALAAAPVDLTLVVGAEDHRYVDIAEQLASARSASSARTRLVLVPGAGHAVVAEAPEAVAEAVRAAAVAAGTRSSDGAGVA